MVIIVIMKVTGGNREYLRSILFGIEDSLITTTGFIAGVSIGSSNSQFVVFSVLVALCIESVSMGVGEYLSDEAVEELDKVKRHRENPFLSGIIICASYLFAGMIPFLPVVLFAFPFSLFLSVGLALCSLFLVGYFKGKVLKASAVKGGIKILVVGGITTLLGVVLGFMFKF